MYYDFAALNVDVNVCCVKENSKKSFTYKSNLEKIIKNIAFLWFDATTIFKNQVLKTQV